MFVILIPFITYDCLVEDHQFIVRCIKLFFSLRSITTIKITVNRHIWFSVILGQFSVNKAYFIHRAIIAPNSIQFGAVIAWPKHGGDLYIGSTPHQNQFACH